MLRVMSTALATAAVVAIGSCSNSGLHNDGGNGGRPIKIGLLVPQSGPFKSPGDDISRGWQLYLDTHGGRLGGHAVKLITGDEGDGQQAAADTVKKLIEEDGVDTVVGTISPATVESIHIEITEKKVPFIGTGGTLSNTKDNSYMWYTSGQTREPGEAIADFVRTTVAGPVYVIAPDEIGRDSVAGFVDAFTAGGGRLANDGGKPTWTPPSDSTDFMPYLNKISATGAKAVFCVFAGDSAINFVKQYAQAGLHNKIPLYSPGFLTEGDVLAAEGSAADGIWTVLNYAIDLDNPANRSFVTAYQRKYNAVPNSSSVKGYDAGLILDQAITAAGPNPTRASINAAIGRLGSIDSPRGSWRFGTQHSPIQPWYLREVRIDGRGRANVIVQTLTTLGT